MLRPSQKGSRTHSQRELDTYAALAKIRGVPSLAPPLMGQGKPYGLDYGECGTRGHMHVCHVHIVVLTVTVRDGNGRLC